MEEMSFAFAPQYSSSPLRPLEFSIAGSRQSFRHRRNLSQPRHPEGHASCPVSLEFEAPRFWVASCFFKVKIGRYSCRSFGHRKAGPMRENLVRSVSLLMLRLTLPSLQCSLRQIWRKHSAYHRLHCLNVRLKLATTR